MAGKFDLPRTASIRLELHRVALPTTNPGSKPINDSYRHAIGDEVLKSIAASLAKPFSMGGDEIVISASVGLALYPVHGMDTQSLIRKADQAMYQARIKSHAGGRSFAA